MNPMAGEEVKLTKLPVLLDYGEEVGPHRLNKAIMEHNLQKSMGIDYQKEEEEQEQEEQPRKRGGRKGSRKKRARGDINYGGMMANKDIDEARRKTKREREYEEGKQGRKIGSKGTGRGLGVGKGRGPIGIPIGRQNIDEKYIGFEKLKSKLAHQKSVYSPGGLVAAIGRHKYGKQKFQAAAGKDKTMRSAKPRRNIPSMKT